MVSFPKETPVTTPVLLTVAIAELLLVHVPPLVALVRVVVEPTQVELIPAIAATTGAEVTVTVVVTAVVQPVELVTV